MTLMDVDSHNWNNIIDFFFNEYYERNERIYLSIPEVEFEDEPYLEFPDVWEKYRGSDFEFWEFWEELKKTLPKVCKVEENCLVKYDLTIMSNDDRSALFYLKIEDKILFYLDKASLTPSICSYEFSDNKLSSEYIISHLFEDDFIWIKPFSLEVDTKFVDLEMLLDFIVQKDGRNRLAGLDNWGQLMADLDVVESKKLKKRLLPYEIEFLQKIDKEKVSSSEKMKSELQNIYRKCLPV
jgi:hypothetical protein